MKTPLTLILSGIIVLGIALQAGRIPYQPVGNVAEHDSPKVTILPNPSVKKKELHLDNRVVYVYGPIMDNADVIAKQILYFGETGEPIDILINSPGGSVIAGAEIVSAIEVARGPVRTICVELCASMAAIIHSYGTERYMINRSVLMFHPATAGAEGEVNKMNTRIRFLKAYVDNFNEHIARQAHLTPEQFEALWEPEHWMTAQDATQQGFNDAVVFVRGVDAIKLYPELPYESMKNNPLKELEWK